MITKTNTTELGPIMIAGCNDAFGTNVWRFYKYALWLWREKPLIYIPPKKQPPPIKAEVAFLVFKSLIKDRLLYKRCYV